MARVVAAIALLSLAVTASALPTNTQRNEHLETLLDLAFKKENAREQSPYAQEQEQVEVLNLLEQMAMLQGMAQEQRFDWGGLVSAVLPTVIDHLANNDGQRFDLGGLVSETLPTVIDHLANNDGQMEGLMKELAQEQRFDWGGIVSALLPTVIDHLTNNDGQMEGLMKELAQEQSINWRGLAGAALPVVLDHLANNSNGKK